MTMAISKAAEEGAQAVICASTGNTSASAAAYAVRAGMTCAVLVPQGKIALGKLAQALVHGAKLLQVDGNFDDCLELAQKLAVDYPVVARQLGQPVPDAGPEDRRLRDLRRARARARRPLHPGRQRRQHHRLLDGLPGVRGGRRRATRRPRMFGFQAAGAAPIVHRARRSPRPTTIATAIRIGNPASWTSAEQARDESRRADRRRHRPADPAGLPARRPQRGRLRRARLGRQRRRPARDRRRRPAGRRARPSCARSPATASRTPSGRSPARRSRSPCPVDGHAAAVHLGPGVTDGFVRARGPGAGAGHQRQPRPRLRRARSRARRCTTTSPRGSPPAGCSVDVER